MMPRSLALVSRGNPSSIVYFFIMPYKNQELFNQLWQEVVDEAKDSGTYSMMDETDLHIATMNRFAGYSV